MYFGVMAQAMNCALCAAPGPAAVMCIAASPHSLCLHCWNAYLRAHEKLCVANSPSCAEPKCTAPLYAPADAAAVAPEEKQRDDAVRLVPLKPADADYARIAAKFGQSMGASKIQRIFRIVNPPLRRVFEDCRARFEKEGRDCGGANVMELFHGTSRAATGAIARGGFDMRMVGSSTDLYYGAGIYFSNMAAVSSGYTKCDGAGQGSMLLCDVIMGDPGKDSKIVGNEYIVSREQQLCPSYVIYYKR